MIREAGHVAPLLPVVGDVERGSGGLEDSGDHRKVSGPHLRMEAGSKLAGRGTRGLAGIRGGDGAELVKDRTGYGGDIGGGDGGSVRRESTEPLIFEDCIV